MPAVIVIFSFLAFAFSSIVMMPGMRGPLFGLKDTPVRSFAFAPPERRAIITDNDGLSHPTADLTHPTKRDRSRRLEPVSQTPSLNIISGEVSAAAQDEVPAPDILLQGPAAPAEREGAIMEDEINRTQERTSSRP